MKFERLFEGRKSSHGILKDINWKKVDSEGKFTKIAITAHSPPDFKAHLTGKHKIGVIPFVENDRCQFGAVDVDEYKKLDHKELVNKLRDQNIPGVLCRSTNGGAHIYFFFSRAVPSHELKKCLQGVRKALDMDPRGEVFPKQKILQQGKSGNYIFLPYYPKQIDVENRTWIEGCDTYCVDEKGNQLTLHEFEEYAEKFVISSLADMNVKAYEGQDKTEQNNIEPIIEVEEEYTDAPPCLQKASKEIIKEGHRDNLMFAFAMFKIKKDGSVTLKDLQNYNQKRYAEPLDNEDLKRILNSATTQKNKIYNCNALENFYCAKEACKFQKYGIGLPIQGSYFKDWLYVKYPPSIVKLVPEPKIYKSHEAKEVMLVEHGMIQLNQKEKVAPGTLYLDKIARNNAVDIIEWHPGQATYFDRTVRNGQKLKVFNNYVPGNIIPIEGDTAQWEDYLDARFKHPEFRKWFEDFFAFKLQHPGIRIMSNILVISDWGGTGKSLIKEAFEELFGIHNTANIDLEALDSGWADIIMNKLFVSIEEIHNTGSHRSKIAAIIKRLTTIKREFGNMKYGKFQQAEVYQSLYFESNSKSAITVKKEDRRPGIYKLDNDKEELTEQNNIEGDLLKEWLVSDNGYEKLMHRMLTRDVSDFSPTKWPPQTEAKKMMVSRTSMFKYEAIAVAKKDWVWPFTMQSRVYCPRHIAKLLKCDVDEVEKLFEEEFKCVKLKRVQNIDFVIYSRDVVSDHTFQVDTGRTEVILYTDDPDLIQNKDHMSPKDCMMHYLHPVKRSQSLLFAQDDRINTNLLNTLNINNADDGFEGDADSTNIVEITQSKLPF